MPRRNPESTTLVALAKPHAGVTPEFRTRRLFDYGRRRDPHCCQIDLQVLLQGPRPKVNYRKRETLYRIGLTYPYAADGGIVWPDAGGCKFAAIVNPDRKSVV